MWSWIKRSIGSPPNAAEKLLNHFDRIAGSKPKLVQVSDEGVQPAIFATIYRGFPTADALTGFSYGFSHFHPPGGGHKELVISMRDTDEKWALACAFMAFQLREQCPFECGDTINFREQISRASLMSAFLITHPRHITLPDTMVDLGVRQVEIVELIPIYEEERAWLRAGGNVCSFLSECTNSLALEPQRKSLR